MPYEVVSNAEGCSGFAVVKVGSLTPIEGGCHHTKDHAEAHATALNIATTESEGRAEPDDVKVGDFVSWGSSGGTARGKIERILRNGTLNIPKSTFNIKATPEDPAALIRVYEKSDDGWEQTDVLVGHKVSTLRKINDLRGFKSEGRAVSLAPPAYMRSAARRGLKLYEEGHGGDGLVSATIADARKMANGQVSIQKWRKIGPWIARHLVDLDAPKNKNSNDPQYPGAGLVAHLLWGSGPSKQDAERAMNYATKLVERFDKEAERGLSISDTNTDSAEERISMSPVSPSEIELEPEIEIEIEQPEAEADDAMESEMETETEDDSSSLVADLRSLLADAISFYLQAHGAHWNVRGSDFSQYHALFAEIYEDVYESIDPIAENVRKLDGDAPFTLTELMSLRNISQLESGDSPSSLAGNLLASNEALLASLRYSFDCAVRENQQGIANFLSERIDMHQKWSWQLKASLSEVMTRNTKVEWVTRSVSDKKSIAFSNMEFRAEGDGTTLIGYAAMFDMPSVDMGFTEYVVRGAFTKTLKDGADVRLLFDHEGAPLARTKSGTLRLTEDDRGLRVEADLDPANPIAQGIMSALRRGDLNQMSFAFRTIKDSWNKERTVRELREVQLYDVSIVTYPAYEQTLAELRGHDYTSSQPHGRLRRQQIALMRMK